MDKEISYIADTEVEKTEAKGAGVSFLGDSHGGELPFEYVTADIERVELVARGVLNKYKIAFEELAK